MRITITRVFLYLIFAAGMELLAQPSIQFTENKGQWDSRIIYEADILSGKLYLEKQGFTYLFVDGQDVAPFMHHKNNKGPVPKNTVIHFHALKTQFEGANKNPVISGKVPYGHYKNYFIGNDRSSWASAVRSYHQVKYLDLYEGIDMSVYTGESGLKYDWIINPGADPAQIKIKYSGAEDIFLNDGKLYIRLSFNSLVENVPTAFQYIGKNKVDIPCKFVLKGKKLSYEVGDYNKEYPLVIDPPILIFATYSGSTADNFGFTATYDSKGCLYAGGNVTTPETILPNGRFPATAGAIQVNFAGVTGDSGPYAGFQCDMAISKYDSSGKQLIWATYLGGTNNDYPHSLVVDQQDRLVILGSTYSKDFPIDTLAYDISQNGSADIVVAKLNFDATALIGSTYIGGGRSDGVLGNTLVFNFADNFRGDVYVDMDNQVYFASCSNSDSLTGSYPVTSDAVQLGNRGGYDGVITILDSNLTKLIWSTYLGGEDDDALYSLKMNRTGNILASGGTKSDNLLTTQNALYTSFRGGEADGMAIKIENATKTVKAFTYFGTAAYDQAYFIDFDLKNDIYLHGQTKGTIPLTTGVYGQPGRSQFIVKLDENMSSILFATTIGNRVNNPDFSPTAFLVDNCYNIYFAGWGSDEGVGHPGSSTGLPVTPDAIFPTTDGEDFYLGVLNKNAQSLLYATFFGGDQTADHVDGGTSRFDKKGVVYHSICSSCPPYPCCSGPQYFISDINTTPGAAFPTNLSPRCSNAAFKLDFQITYAVEAVFSASPKAGCTPLTVNFTNRSGSGTNFLWDFGDGSFDTSFNTTHTYSTPGIYKAWLRVLDSTSCNFRDSMFVTINVFEGAEAEFDFTGTPCTPKIMLKPTGDEALNYFWDFGDSTTSTKANPEHEFTEFGEHTVTLITNPGTVCADTLRKTINIQQPGSGELFIPNIFTPNGDAINACYQFVGLESCDMVEVEIFNRWAEKVYETKDPKFCWTGADYKSGKMLPDGVYYVIATIQQTGKPMQEYKGTITMIK